MFRLQVDSSLTCPIRAFRGGWWNSGPSYCKVTFFGGQIGTTLIFFGKNMIKIFRRSRVQVSASKDAPQICMLWSWVRQLGRPLSEGQLLRIRKAWTSSMDRFVWSISNYEVIFKACWVEGSGVYFCRLQPDAAVPITSSRSMRLSSYDADGNIAVAAVLDFQRFLEHWTRSWPLNPFTHAVAFWRCGIYNIAQDEDTKIMYCNWQYCFFCQDHGIE